jgi:hypothetical protein
MYIFVVDIGISIPLSKKIKKTSGYPVPRHPELPKTTKKIFREREIIIFM